jgi:rfaE bifunctional protein kinase chain/domain/rfaE bifunctional protein nucleotidyltransferase chain/domain
MSIDIKISKKIRSPKEIRKYLSNNKKLKSIMCHGNFDLVHPGHIRHLLYAKSKANILIASCTADRSIKKNKSTPVIPEKLRAKNLASLEMVDFVIIDENETPINNINIIKPDLYIKGYEYHSLKNQKTLDEKKAVEKYGGKTIFSPGDVIYSSTYLKEKNSIKLPIDRMKEIMNSEKFDLKILYDVINKFKKIKVHVVGDTIIDAYNECILLGQTNKTPTFSIKKTNTNLFVGGAAVVAKHLKSLGADVTFTTVLGNDHRAKYAISDLKKSKIKLNMIIDDLRPTTFKERFWVDNYKLLQVDELENNIISDDKVLKISNYLKQRADVIVFSDFRHGIFNHSTINTYLKSVSKNQIKVVDSQVSNRWGNILDFKNFDIIFPNEKEARFCLADQDSPIRPLGEKLLKKSNSKNVILKLSEKGAMCFRNKGYKPKEFFSIDSFAQDVVDGVGAGDALLASSTLSYVINKNIAQSLILGTFSASIACSRKGNYPITNIELKKYIKNLIN